MEFSAMEQAKLELETDRVKKVLDDMGISPGSEVFMLRDACYRCPDRDDHCGIDCTTKDKKYVEKTMVDEACVILGASESGPGCRLKIAIDGVEYDEDSIGNLVFTDRKEALESL